MISLCHVSGQADSASLEEISNLKKEGGKNTLSVTIVPSKDPEQTLSLPADVSFWCCSAFFQ